MDSIKLEEVDLTRKVDIYLDSIPQVLSQQNTAVSVQPLPQAIAVELKASAGPLEADYKAYFTTFPKELEFIATIDEYIRLGQDHIRMLYCYRSVSQAIPEISLDITDDMTVEEKSELAAKKNEINQKIFDVLRPEMAKIKDFLNYTIDAIDCFHSCVSYVCYKDQHKEMIPEGFYLSLIQLLDVLIKLDSLKDFRNGLRKDFARYKRAVGSHPSVEVLEELTQLQNFLANQDARKARNYIMQTVRDEVKRINDHEHLLIDCLDIVLTYLDEVTYVLPEEKFCYLRVIPYLIVILDGELEDPKSSNIFKNGKIKISAIQKLVKKNPVVPLYADMTLTLEVVLQRAPHYDKMSANAWGAEPETKVIESYDIRSYWETVRNSHAQYLIRFSAAVNRYQKYTFQKVLDEAEVEMAKDVYQLVLEGLQKLSRWVMILRQMLAWKYTHPTTKEKALSGSSASSNADAVLASLNREGIEYGLVLRYNLSKEELSALIDFIYMIKSLASHLLKQEALFAPFIRFHIHHSIQQMVQGDLIPLLHRVDKRNKPILPTLLKLRSLAADWLNGNEPATDYKEYTRKQGAVQVLSHPARVVGPAITQLYILRTQVASLCESKSEVRRKESIFGKADLEKTDIELFQRFYEDSFFYGYLLNYSQHIREISDLSDCWYREFFLELTKCVQFPIDLSLPWILIEHVLLKEEEETTSATASGSSQTKGRSNATTVSSTRAKNPFLLEKVFYLFDLYNDAANRSIYQLNSQFLYDEIEAEANLVIDQFYFLLSEEIYQYYKNLSASMILDQGYQLHYEEYRQQLGACFPVSAASRYHAILSQKTIQLLGRSINLSMIFTQNLTSKLHRDIDIAIQKFESYDLRGVVELKTLLSILKMTHELLSNYLLLDAFDSMLQEIDESWSTTAYRGRISLHILTSLARDMIPNFCYNQYTQRFIPAPIPVRPWEYNKAPKPSVVQQCYGPLCFKALESQGRLTRQFFGSIHLQTLLSLESLLSQPMTSQNNSLETHNQSIASKGKTGRYGLTQFTMILDQLVKNLMDKILDLSEYLQALQESIPPCKPPTAIFKSIGAYGYYEGKLKSLLEFDDLKPEVFQLFREIGNTIAFCRDVSNLLEIQDGLSAHFLLALFPTSVASMLPLPSPPPPPAAATGGEEDLINQSPVTKIVQRLSSALLTSPSTNTGPTPATLSPLYSLVKDPLALQVLPQAIERQLHYYASQYGLLHQSSSSTNSSTTLAKNGKNFFKWLCLQLEDFLYQQNFTTDWSPYTEEHLQKFSQTSSHFVIEIENNPSFSKMWSALCFLFCVNEEDHDGQDGEEEEMNGPGETESDAHSHNADSTTGDPHPPPKTGEKSLTNFAEFGHGFSIAGNLLLHLLGQESMFAVLDATSMVLRMAEYENEMQENILQQSTSHTTNNNNNGGSSNNTGLLDPSLVREYKAFVQTGRKLAQVNAEWRDYFQSVYTIRPSYSKYATNRNTFHPPTPPTLTWQ